jgi:hypothetical protein
VAADGGPGQRSLAIASARVTAAADTVTLQTTPRETLFATDRLAADLEELALTVGEGPCVDAELGDPALVPDVLAAESLNRWPVFAGAAAQAGVRAVFALPVQVGAVSLGVLDLFRTDPGGPDREQILIEHAKGVLAERLGLDVGDAFTLLRMSARSQNRRVSELANAVVDGTEHIPPQTATIAAPGDGVAPAPNG